jgi:hypothetical protein
VGRATPAQDPAPLFLNKKNPPFLNKKISLPTHSFLSPHLLLSARLLPSRCHARALTLLGHSDVLLSPSPAVPSSLDVPSCPLLCPRCVGLGRRAGAHAPRTGALPGRCRCLEKQGYRQSDEWICIYASRPGWCAKRTQGYILVRTGMVLRPVDSTVAGVVLHRSACSRDYKLSRERTDLRSFLGRGVCCLSKVCVHHSEMWVFVVPRCVCLCLPFYSF